MRHKIMPILLVSPASELDILLSKFKSAGNEIGIYLSGTTYYLYSALDTSGKYARFELILREGTRKSNHSLYAGMKFMQVIEVAISPEGLTRTGTWTNAVSRFYTETAGDYLEFVTPAATSAVGMAGYSNADAGLSLVTIDGDNTLANKLSTAQQLVDAGTFPNTILIANGGTLNPTDRVIDWYAVSGTTRLGFADNMVAGVHTVRVTATPYKNASSSSIRLYESRVVWYNGTQNLSNSNEFYEIVRLMPVSVAEYAINTTLTATEWVGNEHGNELNEVVTVLVDGVETSLVSGSGIITVGTSSIVFRKVCDLTHPDVSPANIGTVTADYTITPGGPLKLNVSLTWLTAATAHGYMTMMPFYAQFDKGSFVGAGIDYDASGAPVEDPYYGNLKSLTGYMWDVDGYAAGLCNIISSPAMTTNDWANSAPSYAALQDRADTINKLYWYIGKDVVEDEVWTAEYNFYLMWFPDGANAQLARS